MKILKAKLSEAIREKKSDRLKKVLSEWYWKGEKKPDGTRKRIRLIDASIEELNEMKRHVMEMLDNPSDKTPGRTLLLKEVEDQIIRCNTELCIRWIEGRYSKPEDNPERGTIQRVVFYNDLYKIIKKSGMEQVSDIPVKACVSNLPEEFREIPIKYILNGCADNLGDFTRKHVSFRFICGFGIHLSDEEFNEFSKTDVKKEVEKRTGVKINLHNNGQGITIKQFLFLKRLRKIKYNYLSNDNLILLRDVILKRLRWQTKKQVEYWGKTLGKIDTVIGFKCRTTEH